MAEANIWKYAAKNKLVFATNKGTLNASDLFDLKIEDLDKIYANLKKQEDNQNTYTLLDTKKKENADLEIKIQLVKEVFDDKIAAKEAAERLHRLANRIVRSRISLNVRRIRSSKINLLKSSKR
jgi:hypothetical protein